MLFVSGGLSVNTFSVTQPCILVYGGFTNTQTSMITTLRALSYLGCMFALPLFSVYMGSGYRRRRGGVFRGLVRRFSRAPERWPVSYLGGVLALAASAMASAP